MSSFSRRDGDHYILSGQKIWISAAQNARKILILVRTTPLDQVSKPSHGLSLTYTDLDPSVVEIHEIPKMGCAAVDTNSLFFDNWRVPATDLVGQENEVFKMILHGMNAQRILITAEALGLGYAAVQRAATYAGERRVFGQAIEQNQAIQHPLADRWMKLEAARLMIYHAAQLYDEGVLVRGICKRGKVLGRRSSVPGLGTGGHGAWRHGIREGISCREIFARRVDSLNCASQSGDDL